MSFFGKLFSDKDKKKENNESEYLDRVYDSLSDGFDPDPDKILDENSPKDPTWAYDEIEAAEPLEPISDSAEPLAPVSDSEEAEEPNSDSFEEEAEFADFVDVAEEPEDVDLDTVREEPPEESVSFDTEPIDLSEEDREGEDLIDGPKEAPPREEAAEEDAFAYDIPVEEEDIRDEAEESSVGDFDLSEIIPEVVEEEPEEAEALDEDGDVAGDEYEAEDLEDLVDTKGDTDEMDAEELLNAMRDADSYMEGVSAVAYPEEDSAFALLNDNIDRDTIYTAYAPKSMRPKVTETSYYDLDEMGELEEEEAEPKKAGRFKAFVTKKKKWIIGAGVAAAVVLLTVGVLFFARLRMNPLMGYTEIYVSKGNIIKTMEAGGNVEPNAKYNIIPPVGGTITESPLNAGDAVLAGELVYKIDDTNAQIAVQQAQNAVSRAQQATVTDTSSSGRVNIYANSSGTVSGLSISPGSRISGGQIATITQANGTEIGLIPSVTGTVERVNVSNGSTVSSGQVVAVVASDGGYGSSSDSSTRENDITAADLALEQAQKDLEKYKIAAPIDGTILVKNAKVGDSVVEGQTDTPMMVIADMSKMKLKIDVDELDIWNIEVGQTVVITVGAIPGETFSGEITNIAGEGEKKGDGVTAYAVEITVNDPGKIKSGMNVDAKIIIDSAINVLSLPEEALYESDGENALVITDGGSEENVVDSAEYPDITVPEGFRLVKIKYGVNDGDNVEILSGLNVGDGVLYKAAEDETGNSDSDKKDSPGKTEQNPGSERSSGAENSEAAPEENSENIESTGRAATDITDI